MTEMIDVNGTAAVTLTLDLKSVMMMGDIIGEGDDGEAIIAPTFYDNLLKECARQLLGDYQSRAEFRDAIRESVEEAAEKLVMATLDQPLQPTNTWGEKRGEPKLLRDLIRDEALKKVSEWTRSSSSRSQTSTPLSEYIADVVRNVMTREMNEIVLKAKADVRKAIEQKAASTIADAVAALNRKL